MVTLAQQIAPSIVAVVTSPDDITLALQLPKTMIDYCELRIDLLQPYAIDLAKAFEAIPFSKIITVRDSSEGGALGLSPENRLELLNAWLPTCTYLDLELRNLDQYSGLLASARSMGKGVIVSFHDFSGTPSLADLELKLEQAQISGDRIFKVATKVSQWSDLATLVELIKRNKKARIAAMGMGELGKLSRLVLARMGSVLSYCSLGKAIVPGQWPVEKLKDVLFELAN